MCLYPWLGSILHHYYPYPTRPVDIPSLITHGHHHVIHVLRLWLIISSYRCCPTYKPPLVEHMREHSLFRATTQRMLVLPSVLSHNSRNTPASDPWDIVQSLVDHTHPKQAKHNVCFIKKSLGAPHELPSAKASRPPGGGHVPPSAKRFWCYCFYKYRMGGQPLSRSATCFNSLLVL